jgi:ferredoxin
MDLPLLQRATENGELFAFSRAQSSAGHSPSCAPLTPDRLPGPGEQYRFHLEMSHCIGCKCCVVACNEQNGIRPIFNGGAWERSKVARIRRLFGSIYRWAVIIAWSQRA